MIQDGRLGKLRGGLRALGEHARRIIHELQIRIGRLAKLLLLLARGLRLWKLKTGSVGIIRHAGPRIRCGGLGGCRFYIGVAKSFRRRWCGGIGGIVRERGIGGKMREGLISWRNFPICCWGFIWPLKRLFAPKPGVVGPEIELLDPMELYISVVVGN